MADPFQPVRQGQTLDLSARTFNGLLKAGQDYSRRRMNENETQNRGPGVPQPPRVYNGLTTSLGAFSVVQTDIDAIQVDPAAVQFEASAGPVFNAIIPVEDGRPFFITQEPIPVGGIGEVVTNGPTVAWVDVTDENHKFAAVSAGVTECLVSSASGGVPILWKESGTGLKKAEVMLGTYSLGVTAVEVTASNSDTSQPTVPSVQTSANIPVAGKNLMLATGVFFGAAAADWVNFGIAVWPVADGPTPPPGTLCHGWRGMVAVGFNDVRTFTIAKAIDVDAQAGSPPFYANLGYITSGPGALIGSVEMNAIKATF